MFYATTKGTSLKRSASVSTILLFLAVPIGANAEEPDGLVLPPGFHASIVADGVVGARHLAFRKNGDLFVSTRGHDAQGIVALRLDTNHKVDKEEYFGDVSGGTGIRFYKDALYASSPTAIYRFRFDGHALVPSLPPTTIVEGLPSDGFSARPLAFDDSGHLNVGVGGGGNTCVVKNTPKDAPPVGLVPCPELKSRAGIWRFSSQEIDQTFPSDGTEIATGVRDIDGLDYRHGDGLYAIPHDRNGISRTWPAVISAAEEAAIPEEMYRIVKGANLGWPYTYFDKTRNIRLVSPEYGGDGKTEAKTGIYSKSVVTFPGHSAPLDLLFYNGSQFPQSYRGGAFVVLHGGLGPDQQNGHNGYNIAFVPFDRSGHPGEPTTFADGFAGPTAGSKNASTAKYRPVGAAVAPDGSLYVADSQKGRIWRIYYSGTPNR